MLVAAVLTLDQLSAELCLDYWVFLLTVSRHASQAGLQRTVSTLIQPGLASVDFLGVEHCCPSSVVAGVTGSTDILTASVSEEDVVSQLCLVLIMRTTLLTHHTAR